MSKSQIMDSGLQLVMQGNNLSNEQLIEQIGVMTDDPSVCVMGRSDFANRTLRILKMVRAALIYLSLAVHPAD